MLNENNLVSKRKFILISSGDPASISTELIIKALQSKKIHPDVLPLIITDPSLLFNYEGIVKNNWKINIIKDQNIFSDYLKNCFNIIPIKIKREVKLGTPSIENCEFVKESIIKCVKIVSETIATGIVTNPINKNIMYQSGFQHAGHTEFLATFSKKNIQPVMMLVSQNLKTIPLTIQ